MAAALPWELLVRCFGAVFGDGTVLGWDCAAPAGAIAASCGDDKAETDLSQLVTRHEVVAPETASLRYRESYRHAVVVWWWSCCGMARESGSSPAPCLSCEAERRLASALTRRLLLSAATSLGTRGPGRPSAPSLVECAPQFTAGHYPDGREVREPTGPHTPCLPDWRRGQQPQHRRRH